MKNYRLLKELISSRDLCRIFEFLIKSKNYKIIDLIFTDIFSADCHRPLLESSFRSLNEFIPEMLSIFRKLKDKKIALPMLGQFLCLEILNYNCNRKYLTELLKGQKAGPKFTTKIEAIFGPAKISENMEVMDFLFEKYKLCIDPDTAVQRIL